MSQNKNIRQFRKQILYGRAEDLDELEKKIQQPGVIVVRGKAKQGKSWLLEQLCWRLTLGAGGQKAHVGWTENQSSTVNLCLKDAYRRFLGNADPKVRFKAVLQKHSGQWGERFVRWIQKDFITEPVRASTGMAEAQTFEGLPLNEARTYAEAIQDAGKLPLVLVLDGFELVQSHRDEIQLLEGFLRERERWAETWRHCVFILGVRTPDYEQRPEVWPDLQPMLNEFKSWASSYELPGLRLEDGEDTRLLKTLRQELPALDKVEDATILETIQGNAAVLDRWKDTNEESKAKQAHWDGLQALAEEGHRLQYPELRALPNLEIGARKVALRLALLPRLNGIFTVLEAALFRDLEAKEAEAVRYKLEDRGYLDAKAPEGLSYGHDTRQACALAAFVDVGGRFLREQITRLAFWLASQVVEINDSALPYVLALDALEDRVDLENAAPAVRLFIAVAKTTLGNRAEGSREITQQLGKIPVEAKQAPVFLAVGLFNALVKAPAEAQGALLDELRALAQAHPGEAAVREWFAKGLFKAIFDVSAEAQGALLKELRELAQAHPGEAAVREHFAKGLYNALFKAPAGAQGGLLSELMGELWKLAEAHRKEAPVREFLIDILGRLEDRTVYRENPGARAIGDKISALLAEGAG
ncbi:MAG: hypothetical protein ACFBZ8_11085 [Opitutales bacterium]